MSGGRNVVVIGAGALGLGFLGPELQADACVWFLDVPAKAPCLDRIERARGYTYNLAGIGLRPVRVANARAAIVGRDAACPEIIAAADLCFTAVGLANLPRLAPLLVQAAALRPSGSPLPVLCAENGEDVAAALRRLVGAGARLVATDTVMGRMCRWEDAAEDGHAPLDGTTGPAVVAEAFHGIPYRRDRDIPALPFAALQPREAASFAMDEHVKLCAHNCLHNFFACAAARRNGRLILDAAGDPATLDRAERMLYGELLPALLASHAAVFDRSAYLNYAVQLVGRLLSPALADTVARGIRNMAVKLLPQERWVTAIRFLLASGVRPQTYLAAFADALTVSGLLREKPLSTVLAGHCGLTAAEIDVVTPTLETALRA